VVQPIVPYARQLFLCDDTVPRERGKVDFLGAFHSVSPSAYPFTLEKMCVVAHLSGGLGTVNTYVDIRHARTDRLIQATVPREIYLPRRDYLIRVVHKILGTEFSEPGIYLVEFYCEHGRIAEIPLTLRPPLTKEVL